MGTQRGGGRCGFHAAGVARRVGVVLEGVLSEGIRRMVPRAEGRVTRVSTMRLLYVGVTAVGEILANKLRSFFTLLGIIVSVAFLVAVVAVIQGMNAYVKENIAHNVVGTNTFQVRRMPARVGLFSEDDWRVVQRRPKITPEDAAV